MQEQGLNRMEAMKLCYTLPARVGGAPFVHHAVRTMVRLGLAASEPEQVAGLFAGAVACGTLSVEELAQKGIGVETLELLALLAPRTGESLLALAGRLLQAGEFGGARLLLAHAMEHCGDPAGRAGESLWRPVMECLQSQMPHGERRGLVEGNICWSASTPAPATVAAPKAAA